MKNVKVTIFSCCLIAVIIFLASCGTAGNPGKVNNTQIVNPVDYGHGVYYFPTTEAGFGNSLSKFIAGHPTLEIKAMASDGTSGYGMDRGYFVVFR